MEKDQLTLMESLARWATSIGFISKEVQEGTFKVIADVVTAAYTGGNVKDSRAARDAALESWGAGSSPIWFTGEVLSVKAAAFANAFAASVLDLDGGHNSMVGHPGAAIVSAVLAEAHATTVSTNRIVIAVAIGLEVTIRLGAARGPKTIKTHISGHWCGQGVAAAVGWLREENEDTIAHAMAMAGATAPNMEVAAYTKAGDHTKEAIPHSTVNGLVALTFAKNGLTGPIDILDHETFDAKVLAFVNGERWYVETSYFKQYSCCWWIHAPIDAILEIREQFMNWDNVKEILVETFDRTLTLPNDVHPTTIQGAQYSGPFCVALVAIHGVEAVQPLSEKYLADEKVLTLSAKVKMKLAADLDEAFPEAVPGRVTVITDDEPLAVVVKSPQGDASNPMSWDELIQKLERFGQSRKNARALSSLVEALNILRNESQIQPLFQCLSASA